MSKDNKKRISLTNDAESFIKYSVGSDISKEKFDCCISLIDNQQRVSIVATRSFTNSLSGFNFFDAWVSQKCKHDVPIVFLMEATGVYYEHLAWFLHKAKKSVSVVLPSKSKKYLQSLGYKSKNDKIDAKGLAQMGAEQRIEKWNPPTSEILQLRSITRHRQSLQETRTRLNNQLEGHVHAEHVNNEVVDHIERLIETIDNQIKQTEKMIKEAVKKDENMYRKVTNITQIKGVGLVTAATVIAETGGFHMIKNQRQLVSYAGYDVVENQSGNRTGKTKISKKGNSRIRRILHMPSFSVVKNGEMQFVNLYQRVYERTKTKMKGYVAVQRKLLVLIYTLWRKDEAYDIEHPEMQSRSLSFRMAS
jgi:transposase